MPARDSMHRTAFASLFGLACERAIRSGCVNSLSPAPGAAAGGTPSPDSGSLDLLVALPMAVYIGGRGEVHVDCGFSIPAAVELIYIKLELERMLATVTVAGESTGTQI